MPDAGPPTDELEVTIQTVLLVVQKRPDRAHVENRQPSFQDAVVERMLQQTAQGDGTYLEAFRRINVLAKR